MSYKCFNCQKGNRMSERSQHHKGVAGGSWKHKAQKSAKMFKANLHQMKVMYENSVKKVKLCTDCISKLRQKEYLPSGAKLIKYNFNKILSKPISKAK